MPHLSKKAFCKCPKCTNTPSSTIENFTAKPLKMTSIAALCRDPEHFEKKTTVPALSQIYTVYNFESDDDATDHHQRVENVQINDFLKNAEALSRILDAALDAESKIDDTKQNRAECLKQIVGMTNKRLEFMKIIKTEVEVEILLIFGGIFMNFPLRRVLERVPPLRKQMNAMLFQLALQSVKSCADLLILPEFSQGDFPNCYGLLTRTCTVFQIYGAYLDEMYKETKNTEDKWKMAVTQIFTKMLKHYCDDKSDYMVFLCEKDEPRFQLLHVPLVPSCCRVCGKLKDLTPCPKCKWTLYCNDKCRRFHVGQHVNECIDIKNMDLELARWERKEELRQTNEKIKASNEQKRKLEQLRRDVTERIEELKKKEAAEMAQKAKEEVDYKNTKIFEID